MIKFKEYIKKPVIHVHFIGFIGKYKSLNENIIRRYKQIGIIHSKGKEEHLGDRFNKIYNSQHPVEQSALARYTDTGYAHLNLHLMGKHRPSDELKTHDDDLSKALHSHTTDRNMHVFSGMRSPEGLETHNGHIHLKNTAYTSTSIDPSVGHIFGRQYRHDGSRSVHRYVMNRDTQERAREDAVPEHWENTSRPIDYIHVAKIHVPAGSHGAYVAPISNSPEENEFLIHKNAHIVFKPEPTVDHKSSSVIWHGKLVHDGIKPTRHAAAYGIKE